MQEKKSNLFVTIIYNLDAIITAVTLSLATIVVNINVIMRYFFNRPLLWAEEVATGLFVWTVFIGSAYAFRKKAHLGVDILVNAFPDKISKAVKTLIDILVLAVLIMLLIISSQYVINTINVKTETLRLPKWIVSIAVPLGFLLSLYHSIKFIITDAKAFVLNKIEAKGTNAAYSPFTSSVENEIENNIENGKGGNDNANAY